jgi:hypothetical protein
MSRRVMVVAVAIVVIAGLVFTTGCAQIAEQAAKSAIEGATGVKVEDNGVTVTGKDGQSVAIGGETKLPDGFPSEIPVYEGAAITSSIATDKGYMVGLTTPDSARTVLEWYKTELAAKGWEVKVPMESDVGGLVNGTMTGWSLGVNVGGDSGKGETTIVLSATKK